MSDNKKYYYLKLKENFFDSEEMIILQNMPDGYLYSDILMKLYLRSLKSGGKLMFKDLIPYTPSVLAQVVRHQVGTVEKALKIFQDLGLIEVLDNGAIYMLDIQNFIGKSSTEADRKRDYRTKIQNEVHLLGQSEDKCPDKNPPEIEIDIEIEKEIDINNKYIGQKQVLTDTFEKIWKEYPNKKGKAKALDFFLQWVKGRKITGITKKLTVEQIETAVKKYKAECKKNRTEEKFIKHGDTFMNKAILDYIETEKQIEEKAKEYKELNLTPEQYKEKLKRRKNVWIIKS